MKRLEFKTITIYLLIILNILFVNFIGFKYYSNLTNNIINPLLWIIVFLISYSIYKENKQRISYKKNKEQLILIIILVYLMLYVLQGLFFGYVKSPYSRTLIGLLTNIWSFVLIIVYQEYSRNVLVRSTNKIIPCILFIILEINLYTFFQISDNITLFKQISSIILPAISSNILLTYLTRNSGVMSCLLYKIPIVLSNFLLPLFPDIDWFFIAVEQTILPFIVYIMIKNINDRKVDRNLRKYQIKRKNKITIILIIILMLFICFVAGLFKYKPVSVMSNSMFPIFKRGDIVVTEKISQKDINEIQKYDIIEYVLDNIIVMHRVIAIEKHGDEILFITKGDNNNNVDNRKVKPSQVKGIIKLRIPSLGYPSVWLNEFLNKKQDLVETGKWDCEK